MTDSERKATERGEKRDRKVREAIELLDAGVEKVLDGDQFKRYLAFAARFHKYSANNTMLVLLQRPNATRIAGYRRWQELGRQVRRGEEGLKILAPITRTVEDEQSGEKARVLCSFKVVKVFDVSQTDPVPGAEPLPKKPRPRMLHGDSDAARALGRSLLAFCGSEGVPVSEDDAELDALSPGAKGVAYAVLSYFGVDASEHSFAYMARWAESKELVKVALFNIQKAVRTIVEAVEDGALETGTPTSGRAA